MGDWDCSNCGFDNFASRDECFKCGTPRGGGRQRGTGGSARSTWDRDGYRRMRGWRDVDASYDDDGRGGGDDRFRDLRPGDWICAVCDFDNFASRDECFKCHAPKQEKQRPSNSNGDWNCPECGFERNFASRNECFKCHAPKPVSEEPPPQDNGGDDRGGEVRRERPPRPKRVGDWECPKCGFSNFANRSDCHKCYEPKPRGGLGRSRYESNADDWRKQKEAADDMADPTIIFSSDINPLEDLGKFDNDELASLYVEYHKAYKQTPTSQNCKVMRDQFRTKLKRIKEELEERGQGKKAQETAKEKKADEDESFKILADEVKKLNIKRKPLNDWRDRERRNDDDDYDAPRRGRGRSPPRRGRFRDDSPPRRGGRDDRRRSPPRRGRGYDDDRRGGGRYDDRRGGDRYDDRRGGDRYDDRRGGGRYNDRYDDRRGGSRYDNDRRGGSRYDDDRRYGRGTRI